ncbi:MAG: RDD family protein [Solirubrobacteraceae bacterium]|nr:RDD family protein [Patulibacter sp.]
MTDFGEPAGAGDYDLPPYDPYAGWDAPAPYIKDTPPARPAGEAEAIAAGLMPQPKPTVAQRVVAQSPLTLMPALPELPASELPEPGRMYALATFGQRARAMSIDSFILLIPTAIVMAFVMPSVFHAAGRDTTLSTEVYGNASNPAAVLSGTGDLHELKHWILVAGIVASVVYWGVLAVYTGFFMSRTNGQTPGRRAAGIRVMREDGAPITFGWAVYRTVLLREVAFSVVSLFTFGLATVAQYGWSLWDHERRSLHDMIARSRVVVDRGARTP